MIVTANSKAAGTFSSVKNIPFTFTPEVVPRKNVIIGTFDPLKTDIVADVPIQVFSPEDVGAKCGFGFMIHRLAEQCFKGSGAGIETWIVPQDENGTAVAAAGSIDFTGSTASNETLYLYISGILDRPIAISLANAADDAEICSRTVDAINAIKELPVTAAINGVTPEICDITAKSKDVWGNGITIAFSRRPGEETPASITAVITAMTGGSGGYDITTALDALGTGDNANEKFFTEFIHGYGSLAFDDILTYVGPGDQKIGLYAETVHKPFQSLYGDVGAGSAGLTAVLAAAELRRETDRANGYIAVAGSLSHPSEIAALTMGHRSRVANSRPEQNYVDIILTGIDPGDEADRWTNDYANRDTAVKGGVSPTVVRNNTVYLQNVVSFYRPESVPINSNAYASFRNLAIMQNILDTQYKAFNTPKWKNFTIVQDATLVGNTDAKEKVRDIDAVVDEWLNLIQGWYNLAWIYETARAFEVIGTPGAVTIRGGTDGFDANSEVILSGEGNILNNETNIDTSIAILG
ncbi:hypothetical protein AMJ80_02390 [bacterium SM23_31]|nr:MAG: hypothetical protein AMJ80_02390 [bacterium SM23_31]